MPELERMITGGLLAYSIATHPSQSRTRVYDDNLQSFLAELAQYIYFHYDSEVLLWITYCFASVAEHVFAEDERRKSVSVDHFFQHTVMRFRWSKSWEATEKVLKKFLWDQMRLEEWRRKWEEFVLPPGQDDVVGVDVEMRNEERAGSDGGGGGGGGLESESPG